MLKSFINPITTYVLSSSLSFIVTMVSSAKNWTRSAMARLAMKMKAVLSPDRDPDPRTEMTPFEPTLTPSSGKW